MQRHRGTALTAAVIAFFAIFLTSNASGQERAALLGATEWIDENRRDLLLAARDDVSAVATQTGGNGTVSVAYERTHRGLEVFGGDFVVITDGSGNVLNTSVAQSRPIRIASTAAAVSAASAGATARARFDSVTTVGEPEKVIYALGTPRLAWKVAVSGERDRQPAGEDVYIDAQTGAVIDFTVTLAAGTGIGNFNGPTPFPLRTSRAANGGYQMTDPEIAGLHCGRVGTQRALSGTDDAWGNGDGTQIETGCADALYGVQNLDAMLGAWLGRNGLRGDGTGWPVYVGYSQANAFYCSGGSACSGGPQVGLGRDRNGDWLTTLDIVGHEYGHGVDDNTPSGISRRGTQEFVGDVIGTLSEHYDSQSAAYDEPDYIMGEESGLVAGGFRNLPDPAKNGSENCYSSAVDTMQVHRASGPGDHWFYLLAEGSRPKNGNPTSPTCNGSTVTGIGIRKAGKIFYNAMLMKTSASSYPSYRRWTLQAAKNLYPKSCAEFNAVKAAWNAVSVPAQSGEPTCQPPRT